MNLMINRPKNPISTLVFAHGAGAPMDSAWMTNVASLFSERDIKVIRFNFPYMERRFTENKKFPPDRMAKLIKHLELNWEESCLLPEKNKRSVRTASQQQVRKKVYKGSSNAWHKYKPYLNGAFDSLKS